MSAQIVDTVTVYQGAQCKYYIVNGKKYHLRFPMEWAHTHKTFILNGGEYEDKSGPEDCGNCNAYGSIRGVFIGYCGNCLQNYINTNEPRGRLVAPGLSVGMLENDDIWLQYPYMYNIPKSEIGDEEGAEVTDEGINLERLAEAMCEAETEEVDEQDRVSRQNAFCESRMDGCFEAEEAEVEEAYVEDAEENIEYERQFWEDRGWEYDDDMRERVMRVEELIVDEEEETLCDNRHDDVSVISDDDTISVYTEPSELLDFP
jgi:hypothetical protein